MEEALPATVALRKTVLYPKTDRVHMVKATQCNVGEALKVGT